MKINLKLILLVMVGLLGCNDSKTIDKSLEEEQIKQLFQNWIGEVSKSENPDTYFEFVTDDFILSEPNSRLKKIVIALD